MTKKKTPHDKYAGKKPVLCLLSDEQHRQLRMAAASVGKPMAHFVIEHAMAAVEKALAKEMQK